MSLNAQKTREFSPNVLRRIKLRTRLFVTFLIISLVPVITIGIFSYRAYTQSMNEKVKQAALQTIELLNNNMSTQLGIYSDYIIAIKSNYDGVQQRYSLACELAAMLFHDVGNADLDNVISQFLLPSSDLCREIGEKRKHLSFAEVRYICEEYGISPQIVAKRAE